MKPSRERPATPAIGRVLRLDPRGDGVVYEQRQAVQGASWWRRAGGEGLAAPPELDPKLPLARELPALQRRANVSVLAYRPERRLVLRVEDEQGARVLKGYRPRALAEAAVRHRWASQALSAGPLGAAPAPEVLEPVAALGWPLLVGEPLDLHPESAGAFYRIGAGLAQLQGAPGWEGAPRHGPAEEIAVLDGLRAAVERVGLPLPSGWRAVRAALAPSDEHAVVTPVPCHRDLHDGQVLSTARGLVLFDFDLACLADPALDPANLVAHLKLRELQGLSGSTDATVDRCGRELLDGLGRDTEPGFLRRLRFYQGASFLRLALVYALRPPWAHLSRELVGVGERCLHES